MSVIAPLTFICRIWIGEIEGYSLLTRIFLFYDGCHVIVKGENPCFVFRDMISATENVNLK